jgi:hypothetical protein
MPEIEQAELDRLIAAGEAGATAAAALDAATQREAAATGALADTLRAANPDLPPEAIAGTSAAELTASVTSARAIATAAVAAHTAANPPATTPVIPATAGQASAPARTEPKPAEGLRGAERIRAALNDAKKAS